MSQVIATRSELFARRSREGIARRGHTPLAQKRAALIGELRRAGLEAGDKRAEVERVAAAARRALGQAVVVDGLQAVASAAVAASRPVSAEVSPRSVAGVRVIGLDADRVARARTERGYALLASTATIDLAAGSFEAELDALFELVAAELNLLRRIRERHLDRHHSQVAQAPRQPDPPGPG
jgi:V/A-type H+-transporting ATPase subunit D